MTTTEPWSVPVMIWWLGMSLVSLVNIALWVMVTERGRRQARPNRWSQAALASIFTLGCAFRSFLPRAEARRICLFDTWWSNMALSRAIATVAELCFVAQWVVLLWEWSRVAKTPLGRRLTTLFLPLITVAEICSWYSALTTNALGSVIEESLWTFTCGLAMVTLIALRLRARFMRVGLGLGVAYMLFMCTVDVPMYYGRWRADQRAGRQYLSIRDGWRDATTRWIVTRRWTDWSSEVAWMSLYFSGAVWLSIAFIRAPSLRRDDGVVSVAVTGSPSTGAGPR